jgi:hypothetical protein
VVKDLVRMVTYRDTLEHILLINLINVIYVVKNLFRMLVYRNTLEHTGNNINYVMKDLVINLHVIIVLDYIFF